jgi:hypothetical protein
VAVFMGGVLVAVAIGVIVGCTVDMLYEVEVASIPISIFWQAEVKRINTRKRLLKSLDLITVSQVIFMIQVYDVLMIKNVPIETFM